MTKKIKLIFITTILSVITGGSIGYAYSLSTYHWDNTLFYWDTNYLEYSIGSNFSSDGITAVNNAKDHWNYGVTTKEVDLRQNGTNSISSFGSSNSKNEVFKANFGANDNSLDYIGQARMYNNGKVICEVDIALNTSYPLSSAGATPSGSYDVETVMTHEFGHGIGLSHSSDTNAVMYAYLKSGLQKHWLRNDDINGYANINW